VVMNFHHSIVIGLILFQYYDFPFHCCYYCCYRSNELCYSVNGEERTKKYVKCKDRNEFFKVPLAKGLLLISRVENENKPSFTSVESPILQ
jgi:hypothetical protein